MKKAHQNEAYFLMAIGFETGFRMVVTRARGFKESRGQGISGNLKASKRGRKGWALARDWENELRVRRGPDPGSPLERDHITPWFSEPQNIQQGITIEEGWNRYALSFHEMPVCLPSTFCTPCSIFDIPAPLLRFIKRYSPSLESWNPCILAVSAK